MGLKETNLGLVFAVLLMSVGCMAKVTVLPNQKRYVACCDPGLNAEDKDMCKWLHENGRTTLRDGAGNVYEGVWADCKPGEEPWRKWE